MLTRYRRSTLHNTCDLLALLDPFIDHSTQPFRMIGTRLDSNDSTRDIAASWPVVFTLVLLAREVMLASIDAPLFA